MTLRLQIINRADIKQITITELKDGDKPIGRQAYSHPDCQIWLKGRIDADVDYNTMLALQDRHMPVRLLVKV